MPKKHSKIASLAYSDSENEEEEEEEEEEEDRSVEDGEIEDDEDDDYEEGRLKSEVHNPHSNDSSSSRGRNEEPSPVFFEDIHGDRDLSIVEFHRSLFGKRPEEVAIPLPTRRRPSEELQRRIERYYEKVRHGSDLNRSIQARKDLRNPSIYEKMISYCQIDEMATNYPKELYDPSPFLGTASYYEELSRLQTELMEKRNQKSSTAAAAAAAAATIAPESSALGGPSEAKKSKWDSGPASAGAAKSAAVAAALNKAQTLAAAKAQQKPTVVTAFGTINKRK